MKKNILEFVRRGLTACGFGPLVLAVVYLILQDQIALQTLSVREVCLGIISLSILAFIAGGMNVIYQIDRLPLAIAILLHGGVLYVCYLVTYLLNDWLTWQATSVMVFTGIFAFGFIIIWAIIYFIEIRRTKKVNGILHQKQQRDIRQSETE